ncbi:ATP-binding protein [Salinispira pacifica]
MKPFRSFYARLSTVFLVLLIVLSLGYTIIAFRGALRLIDEVEFKLNAGYATRIAAELAPHTQNGLVVSQIKQSIHYMMVMNPRVEIYILGSTGRVITFFADTPDPLKKQSVDLAPIRRFLEGPHGRFIEGEDPRAPGRARPFSAARLDLGGGKTGYVYVILGGEKFESALAMLEDSYLLRTGAVAVALVLLVTGIGGLFLFALLTRRLRSLTRAAEAFEQGDLSRRVQGGTADELDRLGTSFNHMAETIAADIDRMKQIDKLRRDLVANVSHDLRSPLASIRGYIETILMKDESLTPEELRSYLDITLRNTRTLERLVQELFDLSRLENTDYRPNFEQVSMPELLQDVVLKLSATAERRGVEIRPIYARNIPLVRADIALIERVLTNLLENAVRYTPSGGKVTVELSRQGDRVEVAVSDTGCGIDSTDLPYVFDRFYRAERSRVRTADQTGTGSGLGLAIAKRIIELHGGEIAVTSRVNAGSRFSFELVCANDSRGTPAPAV